MLLPNKGEECCVRTKMAARETVPGWGWGFPERGEVINRGLTVFF